MHANIRVGFEMARVRTKVLRAQFLSASMVLTVTTKHSLKIPQRLPYLLTLNVILGYLELPETSYLSYIQRSRLS